MIKVTTLHVYYAAILTNKRKSGDTFAYTAHDTDIYDAKNIRAFPVCDKKTTKNSSNVQMIAAEIVSSAQRRNCR